ncbi:RNA polymerase sigma factor SigJ [Streptomyces sp. NPDC049879]|uniref:RNA polymerase sigma factor SigJ n=1 Tax=Streptomyces sp. NPDC049879 TaxID=3365598 RepID=UPI0037A1D2F2
MTDRQDPALDVLTAERRQLTSLAYRLTGSLADAEDVVQETYARWYAMPRPRRDGIASPGAWLTTVASRICLDLLGSARARRERYVGQWLPEPVPGGTAWISGRWRGGVADPADPADPAERVTLDESVSMAFLVVLDAMTPAERVAFVLHDVFGYPFADVARVVGRTPAACRQLASSARRRVRPARERPVTPAARHAEVVRAFRRAWEAGDIGALVALLAPDATATGDGGGLVTAAPRPVEGAERVARFFAERAGAVSGVTMLERVVNGQPGLVARKGGATVAVLAFAIADDRVRHIWAVLNPEKLRPWAAD